MKIGVVHVNTESASGPYTELVTANLERAKDERTEIVHRYVKHLRRATDTAPVMAPHSSPVTRPSAAAAGMLQCHCRMAAAVAAALKASTEPTDRSMPAMMSTKVMPIAITVSAGISLAMLTKVSVVRKYWLRLLNSTIMPASTAASPR